MLVLLPPSETKRPGGAGAPLGSAPLSDTLRLGALQPQRDAMIDALIALSADEDAAAKTLKLSARQRHEVQDNARLREAPTMAAVDRYTGVLYDALNAEQLDASARGWLGEHVLIHSAPFGPVGALDFLPAYRLGAGVSVPGIGSQKRFWKHPVADALAAEDASFTLDLRSEAYVGLGAAPRRSLYLRIGARGEGGVLRALNHFNKQAKGNLVAQLATTAADVQSEEAFRAWAADNGLELLDVEGECWLLTQ